MSKFKIGDAVKFKPAYSGQTDLMNTPLALYYTQHISEIREDEDHVKVVGDDEWWAVEYWEPFEEWAKHQKPCKQSNREFAILHLEALIAGMEANSSIPVQLSELRLLLKLILTDD